MKDRAEDRLYAIPVMTPLGEQLKWVTKEEAEDMAKKDGDKERLAEEAKTAFGVVRNEEYPEGRPTTPQEEEDIREWVKAHYPEHKKEMLDNLFEEEVYAPPRAPKNEAEALIGGMSAGIAELLGLPPTDSGLSYAESITREIVQTALSGKGEKLEPRYFSGPGQAGTPEDEMKGKLAAALVKLLEWPGSDVDYDIAETVVRKVLDGVK
jgi:hypothetical protein